MSVFPLLSESGLVSLQAVLLSTQLNLQQILDGNSCLSSDARGFQLVILAFKIVIQYYTTQNLRKTGASLCNCAASTSCSAGLQPGCWAWAGGWRRDPLETISGSVLLWSFAFLI